MKIMLIKPALLLPLLISILLNADGAVVGQQVERSEPSSGRPAWVERGDYHEEDADYIVVETEGCSSPLEASDALDIECQNCVANAIDIWLGEGVGRQLAISPRYIRENLVVEDRVLPYQDEYTEEVSERFGAIYGEFHKGYAQLKLTSGFRDYVHNRWEQEQTRQRLVYLAVIGICVFVMMTVSFSYLRLNQATRGFYSLRLLSFSLATFLLFLAGILWLVKTLALL